MKQSFNSIFHDLRLAQGKMCRHCGKVKGRRWMIGTKPVGTKPMGTGAGESTQASFASEDARVASIG
jgi:hypothetical protein